MDAVHIPGMSGIPQPMQEGWKGRGTEGETDVGLHQASEQGAGLPPASPRKSHREVVEEEEDVGGGDPSL